MPADPSTIQPHALSEYSPRSPHGRRRALTFAETWRLVFGRDMSAADVRRLRRDYSYVTLTIQARGLLDSMARAEPDDSDGDYTPGNWRIRWSTVDPFGPYPTIEDQFSNDYGSGRMTPGTRLSYEQRGPVWSRQDARNVTPVYPVCPMCLEYKAECTCPVCISCHFWKRDCKCCVSCRRAPWACSCRRCRICDRSLTESTACTDCSCCNAPATAGGRSCCRCSRYENPGHDSGRILERREGRPWRDGEARLIGIEWEYNSTGNPDPLARALAKWRGGLHHDGSCGLEIVTPPLGGGYIAECLSELGAAAARSQVQCDARCSVHVHVDAKDLYWPQMINLVKAYSHVEPILYLLGGQFRGSPEAAYCIPIGERFRQSLAAHPEDPKGAILSVAYDRSDPERARTMLKSDKPAKKHSTRYRGLNLNPWLTGRRQGARVGRMSFRQAPDSTVEIRIHRNCTDFERITSWVLLCRDLVDYANRASDRDVAAALEKSPLRALVEHVSPASRAYILGRVKLWKEITYPQTGAVKRAIYFSGGTQSLRY